MKLYDRTALIRLLEIRLYRFIGISIDEIRIILDGTDENRKHLFEKYLDVINDERTVLEEKKKLVCILKDLEKDELSEILGSSGSMPQFKSIILDHYHEED